VVLPRVRARARARARNVVRNFLSLELRYRRTFSLYFRTDPNLIVSSSSTGLSTTASSSLSSGELLETPPRAPSSPSAASLQLKPEPLAVEMGGKSSSAPLLENNDAENADQKVPVSLSYLFFVRSRKRASFPAKRNKF